jgi:uncharacterized protein (TIGR00297 family)
MHNKLIVFGFWKNAKEHRTLPACSFVLIMLLLFFIFLLIAIATALVQYMAGKMPENAPQLRKFLHIQAILACAAAVHCYDDRFVLALIFLVFGLLLFGVVHYKVLNISKGESWGIALFPLAFGLLLLNPEESVPTKYIVTGMLVLGISDALAGLVGSRYAKHYWTPLYEQKSVLGSLVFFVSALIIIAIQFPFRFSGGLALTFGSVTLVALATLVEMFSWRGSDNFWIPIVVALGLHVRMGCFVTNLIEPEVAFFTLLFVAPALWWLYESKRWLDVSGSVAAWFMATFVVYFGGIETLVMPIAFLAIGSLASRLNERKPEQIGRNAMQVFANGGPGMLALLLGAIDPSFYFLYPLVFIIAGADTISSEVGKYFKQPTFDIIKFRRVPVGLSGGISVAGTVAGLLGSMLFVALASVATDNPYLIGTYWPIYIVFGFVGMLVDSVLGSLLQGKYRNELGEISDEGSNEQLVSGYHWCTNDMVNWLSILITIGLFFAIVVKFGI